MRLCLDGHAKRLCRVLMLAPKGRKDGSQAARLKDAVTRLPDVSEIGNSAVRRFEHTNAGKGHETLE
ncbi:MAG: hypothetical protein II338_07215, partial [Bacteroidaceae bacterium]|nr:hypothetical protein [Bacteroidaceae bacterium]